MVRLPARLSEPNRTELPATDLGSYKSQKVYVRKEAEENEMTASFATEIALYFHKSRLMWFIFSQKPSDEVHIFTKAV